MIITLRNQIKQSSFRYVAFFIFVVLSVGMISIPSLLRQENSASSWALNINGRKISYQTFAREIAEQSAFLAQVRSQYGQYADLLFQAMGWPTDPTSLACETLIRMALINQLTEAIGIHIHPNYIGQSINNVHFAQQHLQQLLPSFVFDKSGSLDAEKLTMYLQHKGISVKEFEKKVEEQIAQMHALQFVALSSYTPTFDIQQELINKLGKQFSYLTFSYDTFLAAQKKNSLSSEEIQDFYQKENVQRRRYWVPEKRDGSVWKFSAHNYHIAISEEQIHEYYEDNKMSKYVLEPVRREVRQISEKQLAQVPNMTLEMVKDDIMNNPSSVWNAQWESVKPFARGEKGGMVEREAFSLQHEGDISPVIDTKEGKVIIQLVRHIARTYKPLASVRNEIRNILTEKQFKKRFIKDLTSIISQDNPEAIEAIIAQKADKKEMAVGIIKNDTLLSQQLFSLKKGEYGIFMDGATGMLVRLSTIAERNLPECDSIKDIVAADLHEERAYTAMMNSINEAKQEAQRLSFEEVAKKFGVSLHHTDIIRADDNKKTQEAEKKHLPIKTMLGLDKVGSLLIHHADHTSFVIKLDAIEEDASKETTMEPQESRSLTNNRVKMHVESVVASLHRNATIETNESIQLASEEYSE